MACIKKDMELVKGLEHKSCEQGLRELRVFSLEQTPERSYVSLQLTEKGCTEMGVSLLEVSSRDILKSCSIMLPFFLKERAEHTVTSGK